MSTSDRILVELVVAAPIDDVWKALRDPASLHRWFGWDYPGFAEEVAYVVAALATPGDKPYVQPITGMADRFTLEALDDSHTVVRVIRAAPVDDVSWKNIYDDTVEGWLMFMEQLRFMFERHPRGDRRTLFMNGRAAAADTPVPVDALGLGRLVVVPIGQTYPPTKLATGDEITGTVWFRSAYQVGLTIDGFADALVVVTTRPTTAKSQFGGGSLVLSTYGLSDDVFNELCQRWSGWWRAHYDVIEIHPAS
jgi:hypothetical protein